MKSARSASMAISKPLLRDAAATGQAKGQVAVAAPEKQPPEKDRSIVKPFEIGI